MKCGGKGEDKDANDEIQLILNGVSKLDLRTFL